MAGKRSRFDPGGANSDRPGVAGSFQLAGPCADPGFVPKKQAFPRYAPRTFTGSSHDPAPDPNPRLSHSPKAQPDATDFVHDVFDRKHDEHLDAETLENALATLLAMYPDAAVGAHTTAGMMVPMPDSVPLKRNPALHGARSTARLPQRLAAAHGRPERGRARAERDRENGRYRDLSGCARSRMQARALFRRAEVKVPAARRD